jgi:hypothetical protein
VIRVRDTSAATWITAVASLVSVVVSVFAFIMSKQAQNQVEDEHRRAEAERVVMSATQRTAIVENFGSLPLSHVVVIAEGGLDPPPPFDVAVGVGGLEPCTQASIMNLHFPSRLEYDRVEFLDAQGVEWLRSIQSPPVPLGDVVAEPDAQDQHYFKVTRETISGCHTA